MCINVSTIVDVAGGNEAFSGSGEKSIFRDSRLGAWGAAVRFIWAEREDGPQVPGSHVWLLHWVKSSLVFIRPRTRATSAPGWGLLPFSLCHILLVQFAPALLGLMLCPGSCLEPRKPRRESCWLHGWLPGERMHRHSLGEHVMGQRASLSLLNSDYTTSGLERTRRSFKLTNFPIFGSWCGALPLTYPCLRSFRVLWPLLHPIFSQAGPRPYGHHLCSYWHAS